jgi:hypothetical protein
MSTTNAPTFRRSAETELLIKSLLSTEEGHQITYKSLLDASHLPDDSKFQACLQSARRTCQRENGVVFGVVRGVGLKRCTPQEIVELGQDSITRSRHVAKRGLKRILCADTSRLGDEDMKNFNMRSSILALMTFSGSRHAQLKLTQEVSDARKRFEPADAIKLLQSGQKHA